MVENFNENKESTCLKYLDANKLYGWAMSNYMPCGSFKWGNADINILNIPDDFPKGYILQIDLFCRKELHDLHSELSLAPENQIGNKKIP